MAQPHPHAKQLWIDFLIPSTGFTKRKVGGSTMTNKNTVIPTWKRRHHYVAASQWKCTMSTYILLGGWQLVYFVVSSSFFFLLLFVFLFCNKYI